MTEKQVKAKLEEIWTGMMYHCRDLASFMQENKENEFFETEDGKKMLMTSAELLSAHVKGMMHFMLEKMTHDDVTTSPFDIEKMLENKINKDKD